MNPKNFVKLSNIIGTISIILLIYWVFVFISIEVFGLKVFKENITETFYMSILGILALMTGALIINIMFNLTRIAEKHNHDDLAAARTHQKTLRWLFVLSFPAIFGLLYGGDYLTSKKKERLLIQAANSIIEDNAEKTQTLLDYQFSELWISRTEDVLDIMSKTDENFPNVMVIVADSIDNTKVILGFREFYGHMNDTIYPAKKNYILETTKAERDYLWDVFDTGNKEIRFSAHDGNYELYYPCFKDNQRIILHFSDYQWYGKIGS